LGVDEAVATPTEWERMHRDCLIVEEAGAVAGYGYYRALPPEVGHVVHVVTDPAFRRRGVGRLLLTEMRQRLAAAGCRDWLLNVKPSNAGAIALYESFGMTPRHRSVQVQLNWDDVARLPAAELPAVEVEDAAVESEFGLVKGLLANLRTRGYLLVALGKGPLAFAAFDPQLPGAHPFRVREVAYARPLLEALRPHGRHEYIRILAENRPELAELLLCAGATVTLEVMQMRGAIKNESIEPA